MCFYLYIYIYILYYILSTCGTVRQFGQSHENILLQGSNLFGNVFLNPPISFSNASITPRCKAMKMFGSSKWPLWFYTHGQNPDKTLHQFKYWKFPDCCTMCFHPPESLRFFSRMITISDQRPVDHLRSILAMASIGQRNRTRCIVHVQGGYMSIWYRSYYYAYTILNMYIDVIISYCVDISIDFHDRNKHINIPQHSLVRGLHCTQVETIVPLAKLSKKRSVWKLKHQAVRLRLRQTTTNKKNWHTQLDHPVPWWGSLVKQTRIQLQEWSAQQTAGSSRLDIGSSFLHDYLGFAKVQKFTAGL